VVALRCLIPGGSGGGGGGGLVKVNGTQGRPNVKSLAPCDIC